MIHLQYNQKIKLYIYDHQVPDGIYECYMGYAYGEPPYQLVFNVNNCSYPVNDGKYKEV